MPLNRYSIIAFIIILSIAFSNFQFLIEKISFDIHTRTAAAGISNSVKGTMYYNMEGKMLTKYKEPEEIVIINNRKGDLQIYNAKLNQLFQQQNFLYSTESNELYYFLENNKTDIGLKALGFYLHQTKFEGGLKITTWAPPLQLTNDVSHVELVHEKGNPIFIGYFSKDGKPMKKVYFYDYTQIGSLSIPASITKITFKSPIDSIITKSTYSNFKLNKDVKDANFSFEIPADAKIILK
jgi:outer membrane lipoprotein-sorting protein